MGLEVEMKYFISLILLAFLIGCASNSTVIVETSNHGLSEYEFVNLDSLYQVAGKHYQEGDLDKAIEVYTATLQQDKKNSIGLYNLACCYGLKGDGENATKFLKYSFQTGYEDYAHVLKDTDFDKVKEYPEFQEITDKINDYLGNGMDEKLIVDNIPTKSFAKSFVYLPDEFDEAKTYDVIIGLHGWGDNAKNYSNIWKTIKEYNVIYICPEAHYAFQSGNRVGYSWFDWSEDMEYNERVEMATNQYVRDVIDHYKGKYMVGNVYLFGFSQGSGLSLQTAFWNPDIVDGALAFGGWLHEKISEEEIAKGTGMKIFIAHGTEDKIVEPAKSDDAVDRLKMLNNNLKYVRFEGAHTIDRSSLKTGLDWIFKN